MGQGWTGQEETRRLAIEGRSLRCRHLAHSHRCSTSLDRLSFSPPLTHSPPPDKLSYTWPCIYTLSSPLPPHHHHHHHQHQHQLYPHPFPFTHFSSTQYDSFRQSPARGYAGHVYPHASHHPRKYQSSHRRSLPRFSLSHLRSKPPQNTLRRRPCPGPRCSLGSRPGCACRSGHQA